MNKIVIPTAYPLTVKETRTITLDEGMLWQRLEHDIGDILSCIYDELNAPTPKFNDAYEDDWHEAISLMTQIFKGCIDYNLNDSETSVQWVV